MNVVFAKKTKNAIDSVGTGVANVIITFLLIFALPMFSFLVIAWIIDKRQNKKYYWSEVYNDILDFFSEDKFVQIISLLVLAVLSGFIGFIVIALVSFTPYIFITVLPIVYGFDLFLFFYINLARVAESDHYSESEIKEEEAMRIM